MVRDVLDGFRDVRPEEPTPESTTYPGSKQTRRAVAKQEPASEWDAHKPVVLHVKGQPVEFYTVGVLAHFLDRKPPAMRKWEKLGYLPQSSYVTPGRNHHGQKRLYTRQLIEGLVEIAREEGVLGESNRNVSATNFPRRAAELFERLGA